MVLMVVLVAVVLVMLMLIMELERLIKDLTAVKVEVPDKLAVAEVVLEVLEADL
jgi:hypothetical protein